MNIESANQIDTDLCEELRLNGGMSVMRWEEYYTRILQALLARETQVEELQRTPTNTQ